MKIIDILNKKANGTLENGFKFEFRGAYFEFSKANDSFYNVESRIIFGNEFCIDEHLNEEVKVIEENKEIEEYKTEYKERCIDIEVRNKINELVRAVNKLIK